MAVNLSPVAGAAAQFFDNSGNVLTGGKLYTYDAGTTTPAVTYTNSSGATAHSNPIILNAAGRVPDSGEIWLSDSVSYKFVLKDQNDVLIGTYDNLVGINSNFVNFTGEEETQTATQGQTVFTLATLNYSPTVNNLLVFVNGSKQISGVNYQETSSTVVTFVDGLNVGDVVDFCTATPINTAVVNADAVIYNEGDAGAVDRTVASKLQEYVSVTDFGATGDGVTDDSIAIQAAIDTNKKLYFPEGTYLCNLVLSEYFTWQGDGMIKSVLKPYSTALPVVMNLYQEPDWRATSISDIGFESTGTQVGVGFSYGDPAAYTTGQEYIGRVIFNACSFKDFDKGIFKCYGNIGNVYNQCYFQSNNYGSYAIDAKLATGGVSDQMQPDTDTWNGGEFHYNKIAAVCCLANAMTIGQLVFNQTIMQFNPGFAVYMSVPGCGSTTPAAFNEVWFEGNATDASVVIPVVSGGVVTPTSLPPKTVSISDSMRAYNFFSGAGGTNGIATVNPEAPLGIWGDRRTAFNLISDPTVGYWTALGFSSEGSESTIGATIKSFIISGTDRNIILGAGAYVSVAAQPNGSVQLGQAAIAGATPADGSHQIYANTNTEGVHILDVSAAFAAPHSFYVMGQDSSNAAACGYKVGKNTITGRSINAGGTINASGADYAEYMTKAGNFTIAKGDICGIDANGQLTNVFADAVSFVVKSTNPSYVGGDNWGSEQALGFTPLDVPSQDASEDEKQSYVLAKGQYDADLAVALEAARQNVDRVAFAGQVPVNVDNAKAGEFIVPVPGSDGSVKGISMANPTFEQYQNAVGKVISVAPDGTPTIIVKVV